MKTLLPVKNEPFNIELLRDKTFVVRRSGGDAVALKRALKKLDIVLKKMPRNAVDTVAEIRLIRDSGGPD